MKDLIVSIISAAIEKAHAAGKLKSSGVAVGTESPKDPSHGDIASNVALALARPKASRRARSPRSFASTSSLPADVEGSDRRGSRLHQLPDGVRATGIVEMRRAHSPKAPRYFRPRKWTLREGGNDTMQVEFLSANPTGPLTVGHGRNAVLGDTIARMYEAAGFTVNREYYFNDGGRQMRLLGESVRVRYLQELGRDAEMPKDGYQGEYIIEIARALRKERGDHSR